VPGRGAASAGKIHAVPKNAARRTWSFTGAGRWVWGQMGWRWATKRVARGSFKRALVGRFQRRIKGHQNIRDGGFLRWQWELGGGGGASRTDGG